MTVTIWIPGDQLLEDHPALHEQNPKSARLLLIESERRLKALPWQRKKRILVISAMRHYAERLRERGWQVDYVRAESVRAGISAHLATYPSERLLTMAASEYDARQHQQQLALHLGIPVTVLPNRQFLVGEYDPFPNHPKRVVMENFYRQMRRHFRVLMAGDEPVSGRWNYDEDNRKRLPKNAAPPAPAQFAPDAITARVMAEADNAAGYGASTGFAYAVTHEDARAALADFITHRLPSFGDYEDAMSSQHDTLYHAVLSPYVNIGLLTPMEIIRAAEHAWQEQSAPLNAVEGFVRQVLGWREYMYWQYWRLMPTLVQENAWDAQRPLPDFFWTGDTDMACLRHTLRQVIDSGYTHHIPRLMLISNFCLLAGVQPQEVVRWFMSLFVDAYDWVMQPNTVGMGLNADGGKTATKPYIASAAYIHRMSDYCGGCVYDHKARTGAHACPFNTLYWNFLIEHEAILRANPRMGPAVLGLKHLDAEERANVQAEAALLLARMGERSD
jgi:deoxyribodipyrimidine photolyase-related protein